MTIGQVPWPRIREQSARLAALGGPEVPADCRGLTDLPVLGPAENLAVSRAVSRGSGALLMSSGGTTGRPKVTFVAYHQALDRLAEQWRPLAPGNLLLNLFTPGRMWASHYYMQGLAEHSGCDVVPAGPFAPHEVAGWITIFKEMGVDAVAGTPSALADLARGVLDAGETLPLRTLIWMAEPWTPGKEEAVRAAFPGIGFWGNYGSVENYVMATNTPRCDLSVLHLMPDQVIEPDDDGALLTRVGGRWTVPTVRYRLGDRVAPAECRCGRPDALRVLGRADDAVKLHGALFGIGEILGVVTALPGVEEAQLVLTRQAGGDRAVSRITVRFSGDAEPGQVRAHLVGELYDLGAIAGHRPDAVAAERVDRISRVDRTNKVPPALWQEEDGQ